MRRAGLWTLPAAGLAAWIGAVALGPGPHPARAQTPPVKIHRVQSAGHGPARASDRPVFILVLGSDARPGEPVARLRSDSIHLVGLNAREGSATILGFPRDSYVPIPGAGTRRINEAMVYGGPELAVQTVSELTGIRIDYYALTSFGGLKGLVNGVGGVQIEILYSMNDAASGTDFEPGRRRLDGGQALAFARDRHSAPLGDFGRSENQGRLLVALLQKLRREFAEDPTILVHWIRVAMTHVETDLSLPEVFDLAATATQIDPDDVTNLVVPGSTGSAGGASVVLISSAAEGIYRDLEDDGFASG